MAVMTIAQDSFIRANQSGFGTTADGETWANPGVGTLSIVSNRGQVTNTTGTGANRLRLGNGTMMNGDIYERMSLSSTTDNMGFIVRYVDTNNYVQVAVANGSITVRVVVANVGTNLTPTTGITISASTNYQLHINLNNNVYSINVWLDGNAEPAGWVCQATDGVGTATRRGQYGTYAFIGTINDIILVDSYLVTSTPPAIYVSTTGNDSTGDGSLGNPYLTLGKADAVVPSGGTVNVVAGTYSTGASTLTTTANGTPLAHITWQSITRWGALIRTTNPERTWACNGSYVDILSFDITVNASTNVNGVSCLYFAGSFCSAKYNHIHDAVFTSGTHGGAGINMINTATNITYDSNFVHDIDYTAGTHDQFVSALYLEGPNSVAQNNIIYNSEGWGINCGHASNHCTIVNNLLWQCNHGGIVIGADTGLVNDFTKTHNNILYNINGFIVQAIQEVISTPETCGPNNTYMNNCVYGGTSTVISLRNGLVDIGTVRADPQFINYRADGAGDYHLLSTSPCIDAGTATGAPTTDFDSNARPQSGKYDIGAYEFVPGVAVPSRTFIGGSSVFVIAGSLNFDRSIGKNSQASFNVQSDNNTHFQQDQTVRIVDQTTTLVFSGYVTTPKEEKPGFQPSLEHTITCTNQHRLAEKRLVAASYVNKSPGYMVNDIYTNILAAEGVTIGLIYDAAALTDLFPGTGLFPSTTLYPTESVGIVPEATFVYCTVAQAFDALVTAASANGVPYYWMIDHNKALWFAPYTAVVNSTVIDGTQIDDGHLTGHRPTVTRANPTYRNTQYLIGGVAQTVSQTETRKGDSNTVSWPMSYDLATAPTITVNAVSKAVGIRGIDTGKDWYWQKGSPDISQDSAGTKLVNTDTLSVTYIGQYPTVIVDRNNAQVSYEQSLDGTTGIVEEVESDTTISSIPNGLAKTSAFLTRYAAQGAIFEGMTMQTGYAPGQLATFDLPDFGLYRVQMLIEDISASDQIDGINIWYLIKAVLGPYDQNWVSFFKVLFKSNAPINSINVGVSQSTLLLQAFTASLSPAATLNTSVFACPIVNTTLFPSTSLLPC